MTDNDRSRLRKKQDRIIELAEKLGINESLQIAVDWPSSPTIRELRYMLYPEYEDAINYAISYLEKAD